MPINQLSISVYKIKLIFAFWECFSLMNILDHNKIHDKQIYKYPQLCLVMFSAKSRVGIRDEFAVAEID